jgi:hypothetical protein
VLASAPLAAVSAGNKAGLAVVAGAFIVFAVISAYVVPSRWPDFPGGSGLRPFLAATAGFFVAMMLAVWFFAREEEEPQHREQASALVAFRH